MNKEVNLLARYPKARRNVKARLGNKEENRRIALQFGKEYFDGTREQGYGGYRYRPEIEAVLKGQARPKPAPAVLPAVARQLERWKLRTPGGT